MNPEKCKHRAPVGDWCRLATNQKCKILCSSQACPIAQLSDPSPEPKTKPRALPQHLTNLLEQCKPTPRATLEPVTSRDQHFERSKQIAVELAQPEPDAWMNTIPAEAFQDGTRLKRPPRAKPLFTEIECQLEQKLDEARDRVGFNAHLLEQEAQQLVSLILTSEHRALLHQNIAGKRSAAQIVEAILLLVARQRLQGVQAEYVACTAQEIADLTGLSLSTINHTLSQGRKGDKGDPNLKRWLSWKSVYAGEELGTNGRCVGTLFRVAFRPRDLGDAEPAPVAQAGAFQVAKAHLLESQKTPETTSHTLDSFDCKKTEVDKTFSKKQENAKPQLLCFGDASFQNMVQSQTALKNNDCKSPKYHVKFILDANAEARAYAAMDKLADAEGNFHFWYGLFKKALEPKSKINEHQIWAVISDAKDASARGVVKSSVVQYAVGALIRGGIVQPAAQRVIFEAKLETVEVSG
jgi:DNA-directed RNA polymerase specialized sigma24 family protein